MYDPSVRIGVLALLLVARVARADDAAVAQGLYEQARQLVEQTKFAEACPLFAASFKADPQLGVLLNLADCHEKVGKLATAWGEFRDAVERAQRKHDEREAYAKKRADALAPRVDHVKIVPPTAHVDGMIVKLDDADVTAMVGVADAPVDPGEHVVSATARGFTAFRAQLTIVGEGTTTTVQLALPIEPGTDEIVAGTTQTEEKPPPPPPRPRTRTRLLATAIAGWTLSGPQPVAQCAAVETHELSDGPTGALALSLRHLLGERVDLEASLGVMFASLQGTPHSCLGILSGNLFAVSANVLLRWRPGAWFVGIGPELGWIAKDLSGTITPASGAMHIDQSFDSVVVGGAFEIGRTIGSDEPWEIALRVVFAAPPSSPFGAAVNPGYIVGALGVAYAFR